MILKVISSNDCCPSPMIRTLSILLCVVLLRTETIAAQNPIGLRAGASLRGVLFGTAVDVVYIRNNSDNGQYTQQLTDNYLLIVPETELKPMSVWQGENIYNWADADFLLGTPGENGWVQENYMQIRGHNLVWAYDEWIPEWLLKSESTITPDKAKQLLSDYIHAVVGRYRGKILCWDVINEAVDDYTNTNPLNIKDSFWLRKLGLDYLKYAFIFAHEADPDVKLYYNEYGIENVGIKVNRTLALINWLRSEGAIVDGIGLQWHIDVTETITPGDGHYQSAQQFIDNGLDIMVTELDVSVPTDGGYPVNYQDLQTQANVYESMLNYVLHFAPHCKAMLTWGFTDRYSWIPWFRQDKAGAALPLDWMYLPKAAYWRMLDMMTHILPDAIYRLSPAGEPDKCLGISQDTVQLYDDGCNNAYEKWNITWLGDGTYRFSSMTDQHRVLSAYNTTASVGGVEISEWTGDQNQGWAFSDQGNNTYRVVIRTAWWRVMSVYGTSDQIGIVDGTGSTSQKWILTKL